MVNFIEEAIKLSTISERIIEEYGVDEMKCRQHVVHCAYTLPYKRPLRDVIEPLERGGQFGLMTGDLDMGKTYFHFQNTSDAKTGSEKMFFMVNF